MWLTVDGFKAFVGNGGGAFDPAQPVAVFLPGAGFDHTAWAWQTRWFAHHGWTVLAPDLPAHGASEGDPLTTIGAMADWVIRLIAAAGVGETAHVRLIGHSMGALVALETAARYGTRIAELALIGVTAAMPVHPSLLEATQTNLPDAIDMMVIWGHGFRAGLGGSPVPGVWMTGVSRRVLERARPGVLYADLAACNAYTDGLVSAAKVTAPVRLILGEFDMLTSMKGGMALPETLPNVRVTVIERGGHMLMAERPDELLAALIAS